MKISSIIAIACLLSISVEETMAIRQGVNLKSLKEDEVKENTEKPTRKSKSKSEE